MYTDSIVEVGPWGGNRGGSWKFKPNGRITEIWISSEDYIDSIRFVYMDQHQVKYYSPKYGGDGGTQKKIIFDEDEEIRVFSGRTGDYVISLFIMTNKRHMTFGPTGGKDGGANFTVPVVKDSVKGNFVGFFGGCGLYLDAIGTILQF